MGIWIDGFLEEPEPEPTPTQRSVALQDNPTYLQFLPEDPLGVADPTILPTPGMGIGWGWTPEDFQDFTQGMFQDLWGQEGAGSNESQQTTLTHIFEPTPLPPIGLEFPTGLLPPFDLEAIQGPLVNLAASGKRTATGVDVKIPKAVGALASSLTSVFSRIALDLDEGLGAEVELAPGAMGDLNSLLQGYAQTQERHAASREEREAQLQVNLQGQAQEDLEGSLQAGLVGAINPLVQRTNQAVEGRITDLQTEGSSALASLGGLGDLLMGPANLSFDCPPYQPGEDPTGHALGLIRQAFVSGLQAHTIATLVEMVPWVKHLGVNQLAGYVGELADFRRVLNHSYDVYLQQTLAFPIRYHVNLSCRPLIPPLGTVQFMQRKRGIPADQARRWYGMHGLADSIIDQLMAFNWSDPSPFLLRRMSEIGIVTEDPTGDLLAYVQEFGIEVDTRGFWWLYAKNLLAGYDWTDARIIANSMLLSILGPARTQLKTGVRRRVRLGWAGAGWVTDQLDPWNVRADEIELLMQAEEVDFVTDILEDQVRIYRDLRRSGQIDEQEQRTGLLSMGLDTRRVEAEAIRDGLHVKAPRRPQPIRREDPAVTRLRNTYLQGFRDQFRDREIGHDAYYDAAVGVGLTREQARATVFTESARRMKPPRFEDPYFLQGLTRADLETFVSPWGKQFAEGTIDESTFFTYLIGAGLPDEVARWLVDKAALSRFLEGRP